MAVLVVVALLRSVPYHWFVKTHRLIAVAYLPLVWRAAHGRTHPCSGAGMESGQPVVLRPLAFGRSLRADFGAQGWPVERFHQELCSMR